MKKHCLVYFNFLLISFILVPSALADWINLTGAQSAPNIAEIHVNADHIPSMTILPNGMESKWKASTGSRMRFQTTDSGLIFKKF